MPKNKINIYMPLVFMALMLSMIVSCKSDHSDDGGEQINVDSLELPIKDTEVVIKNIYTDIANKLCNDFEFTALNYTNLNTQIYPIDSIDSTKMFVFVSEVDCGYTAGSCGKRIKLIKRISNNNYEIIYSTCGKIDSIDNILKGNQADVYFSTPFGRNYVINWRGKSAISEQLSYQGMPVGDLKDISENTDILLENFIKPGTKTDNMDAIPVNFSQEKLGNGITLNVYTFSGLNKKYGFVYLNNQYSRKQKVGGEGSVTTHKIDNENFEITYHKADNTIEHWQFSAQTKKFTKNNN